MASCDLLLTKLVKSASFFVYCLLVSLFQHETAQTMEYVKYGPTVRETQHYRMACIKLCVADDSCLDGYGEWNQPLLA